MTALQAPGQARLGLLQLSKMAVVAMASVICAGICRAEVVFWKESIAIVPLELGQKTLRAS